MRNKKLNRKSHVFFAGFVSALSLGVILGTTWYMVDMMKKMNEASVGQRNEQVRQVLAQEQVNITLQRTYVCGTEEEEHLTRTTASLDQLLLDYKDWELVSNENNRYVFKKFVQDLSPVSKENGYFGLTNDEVLTLFNGPPHEQNVIQTFFQINTEKFESGLFRNDLNLLKQGIRIHDLSEYNSILSTYGEYADENLSSEEEDERWS